MDCEFVWTDMCERNKLQKECSAESGCVWSKGSAPACSAGCVHPLDKPLMKKVTYRIVSDAENGGQACSHPDGHRGWVDCNTPTVPFVDLKAKLSSRRIA